MKIQYSNGIPINKEELKKAISNITESNDFNINKLLESLDEIEEKNLENSLVLLYYILLEENLIRIFKELDIDERKASIELNKINPIKEQTAKPQFLYQRIVARFDKIQKENLKKDFLQKISKKELNEPLLENVLNLVKIAIHKGTTHPYKVYKIGMDIFKREFQEHKKYENLNKIYNIKKIIMATLLWHDIGRFGKDINHNESWKENQTHGIWAIDILKAFGIKDPYILLPIKYHGYLDMLDIEKDHLYVKQKQIDEDNILNILKLVRDADKLENLIDFSKPGRSLCYKNEINNIPEISQEVIKSLQNDKMCDYKYVKHIMDNITAIICWQNDINFESSKNIIKEEKAVEGLWANLILELYRTIKERNLDCNKQTNKLKLNKTKQQISNIAKILIDKKFVTKENLKEAQVNVLNWLKKENIVDKNFFIDFLQNLEKGLNI